MEYILKLLNWLLSLMLLGFSWYQNTGPIVLKSYAPTKGQRSFSKRKVSRSRAKRIDLSEPGLGKVKVAVDDAPMDLSNDMIREVLSVYGEVLDVRNDYLHVGGNRVPWWNGTRHVDMCNLKSEIPPALKVRHGQNDIKIKLWHLGQTHI